MMPLFGRKKNDPKKDNLQKVETTSDTGYDSVSSTNGGPMPFKLRKTKFSFQCQLAHGSPTGIISDFKNIRELYSKIADCFGIDMNDIIFCTLNTHKIDMDHLLGSHIGLDDFIFVHIKGQKKEVELFKSEESLGITITDNGAGHAFIKRIRESSPISKLKSGLIDVGDHIERIDNETFLDKRHFDVARKLRSIEVGTKFTIRLISPEKSIYSNIKSRSEYSSKNSTNIVNGNKTLRLTDGGVFEEDLSNNGMEDLALRVIGRHIEKALGIADNDMAQDILNIGMRTQNPVDFTQRMNEELGDFQFPETIVHDFWGVITDSKAGLLKMGDSSAPSTPTSGYTNIIYEDKF